MEEDMISASARFSQRNVGIVARGRIERANVLPRPVERNLRGADDIIICYRCERAVINEIFVLFQ
jgi:hypothetical protein